jgi:uncharacterized membrane protein YjgN (DUF898 family)
VGAVTCGPQAWGPVCIRFSFIPDYIAAYVAYTKGFLASAITFGLGTPLAAFWAAEFNYTHTRYGSSVFKFGAKPKDFLLVYAQALGILILIVIVFMGIAMVAGKQFSDRHLIAEILKSFLFPILIFATAYAFFWIRAGSFRVLMNSIRIEGLNMEASVKTADLAWIQLSGALASVVTFGLAYPWAKIRSLRYIAPRVRLRGKANALSQFMGSASATIGAGGEAAVDFFDIDLGF